MRIACSKFCFIFLLLLASTGLVAVSAAAAENLVPAPILVFGHKNPDTDTAVSAMAAAHLLNKTGRSARPMVQGEVNPETAFVLEKFHLARPELLSSVDGRRIGLVDFNEYPQGPDDLRKAELVFLVDHHRLGGMESAAPVEAWLWPVGCTSTILFEMCKYQGVEIPADLAGGMLAAILSDTVSFKSATTTEKDRAVARELAALAGVVDMDALGKELFAVKSDFAGASSRDLLIRDYKEYVMGGRKIGIGQIETLDIGMLADRRAEFFREMENLKQENALSAAVLMLTDITREGAEMLVIADEPERIAGAFSASLVEGSFWLEGVMSRKKQVVPPLEKALAEVR